MQPGPSGAAGVPTDPSQPPGQPLLSAGASDGAGASPAAAALPAPPLPQQLPLRGAAVALEQSSILKLKGLPYTATEQQIREFFQGFSVLNISFVFEPDGRPSGLAFAEFSTREEALQAMVRNGEYLGDRYVRLLHVPRQEMEEQVRMGTLAIPGQAQKMRSRMMRGVGGQQLGGDPYADAPLGMPGAQQLGHMPNTGSGMYAPSLGQHPVVRGMQVVSGPGMGAPGMAVPGMGPAVMGPGGMTSGNMAPGGMVMAQDGTLSPATGNMGVASMGGMAGMAPYHSLVYQMGGMSLGPGANRPHQMVAAGPMVGPSGPYAAVNTGSLGAAPSAMTVIGTDSKTIKIRGLPFRGTPLDILNFFEGFAYVPESLQLGVDALGRPSGEAWLTFESSDEALRSVREKNRQYLGSRYLELSLT